MLIRAAIVDLQTEIIQFVFADVPSRKSQWPNITIEGLSQHDKADMRLDGHNVTYVQNAVDGANLSTFAPNPHLACVSFLCLC